jgi:hypothetical protein
MNATSKRIYVDTKARFVRALVKAAVEFAPSVDALRLAVVRHFMDDLGTPELISLFDADEVGTNKRKKTAAKKTTNKTARIAYGASTPISDALAGVPRFRTLENNGITTLGEASAYSERELAATPGLGPGLIDALKKALSRASMRLRADA